VRRPPRSGGIPERAVLLGERDQLAGAFPGGAAGVGQQHQCEQAARLGDRPRQVDGCGQQHPGQADRFGGELGPLRAVAAGARVALVEHQVEHLPDHGHALCQLAGAHLAEARARRLDRRLRPADALRHRRLRHQERARDLRRRQAAYGAEGQGQLRRGRDGGVAAEHKEVEGVVAIAGWLRSAVQRRVSKPGLEIEDRLLALPPRALAAPGIHQSPPGDGDEPRARVVGDPLLGPLPGGGDERLLHRVLARLELPVPADERAEHARGQLAKQVVDGGSH
jgi:hypothetical protein